MTLSALWELVFTNVLRSKKNFVMSAFGIIVGISTFVFFIGLGEGIKNVVLGKIFLVDQVVPLFQAQGRIYSYNFSRSTRKNYQTIILHVLMTCAGLKWP